MLVACSAFLNEAKEHSKSLPSLCCCISHCPGHSVLSLTMFLPIASTQTCRLSWRCLTLMLLGSLSPFPFLLPPSPGPSRHPKSGPGREQQAQTEPCREGEAAGTPAAGEGPQEDRVYLSPGGSERAGHSKTLHPNT